MLFLAIITICPFAADCITYWLGAACATCASFVLLRYHFGGGLCAHYNASPRAASEAPDCEAHHRHKTRCQ